MHEDEDLDGPAPEIETDVQDFPSPLDRLFQRVEIMGTFGAYYFILGPLLSFMVISSDLAKEKELRLRQGLNVVGVSHTIYWIHWTIVGTILNILQCFVLCMCGYAFDFVLWHHVPVTLIFYIFFWVGQCMVFLAFLISTFTRTMEAANKFSYSIILLNLIVEFIFSDVDLTYKLFYSKQTMAMGYVQAVRTVFEYLPTFSFSYMFGVISHRGSYYFNFNSFNWQEPRGFDWSLWDYEEWYQVKSINDWVYIRSVSYMMHKLQTSFWVIVILFWYFDHVLASNRGAAYALYFPFQPAYWRSVFPFLKNKEGEQVRNKKKRVLSEKDLGTQVNPEGTIQSVDAEMKRVLQDEEKDIFSEGIRIVGIQKVYFRLPFGIKSSRDVHAVKGVFMNIDKNELLCLLGHNGAGKSTLFNMLTGILGPTEGYAKICGLDIRSEQEQIRRIIGVVPQFDILWDQLTAMEHMRMFSKIKGVPN